MNRRLTAIVECEGDGYIAFCPEVDVASQGETVTEARENLAEALTLFFESASVDEIERRLREETGSCAPERCYRSSASREYPAQSSSTRTDGGWSGSHSSISSVDWITEADLGKRFAISRSSAGWFPLIRSQRLSASRAWSVP